MTDPAAASALAPSRRQVLLTGGVVAASVALTAACGSSSSASSGAGAATTAPPSGSGTPSPAGGGGGTTVATADVPVGGGTILKDAKVVVTQPAAGTYKAYTAVCTHQGCLVASVADGVITCPCHGSTYSAADGSVTGGPATGALKAVPLTVSGSTITLA